MWTKVQLSWKAVTMSVIKVNVADIVGGGYGKFWRWQGRYRVVKGSRASKKSKTTALWYIYHMMKYPAANLLVVRKVARTLQNSCFSDLCWAIERLHVGRYWRATRNPMEIIYIPTGQRILFVGLDDPLKITSISVPKGVLCWMWIEEAYEITREDDFDRLDESIRGLLPDGLFTQVTITFNPWSDRHWLKKRFFDDPDENTLAMTTNYMCNEYLSDSDMALFEAMKKNPKRYRVAGLGNWGVVEGFVYDNWEEKSFDIDEVRSRPGVRSAFGLDFGYTNDPTALFCGLVDKGSKTIYVFDEMYERGLTNQHIAKLLIRRGYGKERIIADSAEPKSIAELREAGIIRVHASRKGKDSINNGIQRIQDFHIVVHPRCVNFLTEISTYQWDTDNKTGVLINKPVDYNNHLMDAMRYGIMDAVQEDGFSFA
jgi:phage terminase large subunit|nr:MAG TPA: terminase large subunit [Caudoviricetes sp.]